MYRIKQTILLVLILSLFPTLISSIEVTAGKDIILTMRVSPPDTGTTSPSAGRHRYDDDDETVVDITAIPDTGWQFDSWTGDVADPNSASTTVTMDRNKTVTANFTEIAEVTYNLTMAINGNGTISPTAGTHTYNEGEVVDITATPDTGWEFDGWTGDLADSNSASTTVTIDGDKTITANFTQITHDLTMAVSGNGSTSPSAGTHTYNDGEVVDITATPDSGWEFVNWTGDLADSNSASTTVTIDGDKTVTANFTQITHDLTMAVSGNGSTSPSAGTHTYNEGEVVDITATPDSGWQFVNWAGDVAHPDSASTTVTMDRNKTVTANFTRITHDLTMAISGNGSTSPSVGFHTYSDGEVVDITATPDSGWEFVNWTGDLADSNSASTTVTMDGDKTVTANFTQIATHVLTMAVNGNGTTGPSVGTRIYNEGSIVNITATPDSGWEFVNWTGDVNDPNSANTTVTMNADKTVTANFSQITWVTPVLTITTNGNGTTSPSAGSHSYNKDTVIDITATPNSGWLFDSWSGEVDNPYSASITVSMDEDKTLIANFNIAVAKIQVDKDQNSLEGVVLLAIFVGAVVFLIIGAVIVIVRSRRAL